MTRRACCSFADSDLVILDDDEPDDPQEVAGDAFAEFDCSPCPFDPAGHLFKTACGATKCVWCNAIAWK